MRRRLRIEQDDSETRDGFGAREEDWKPVVNTPDECVYAEVDDLTGREFFNAGQVQADVNCRIVVRRFEGVEITADMRAVDPDDNDVVYHFASVRWLDNRRMRYEIMAIRKQANPRS